MSPLRRARGLKYFSTVGILFTTIAAKLTSQSASLALSLKSDYTKTSSGLSPPKNTSI